MSAPSRHETVDMAMKWLDPQHPKVLEIEKLQQAYDSLLVVCSCTDIELQPDNNGLRHLCDLYRAVIVASMLMLNLEQTKSAPEVLKESIERSLLLLRILTGSESETELMSRMPVSTYALLNALLDEPLIPIGCTEARRDMWNAQEEEDDDDDDDILTMPDKRQLALEEAELIQMAQSPIPTPVKEASPTKSRILPIDQLMQGSVVLHDGTPVQLTLARNGRLLLILQAGGTSRLLVKLRSNTRIASQPGEDDMMDIQLTGLDLQFKVMRAGGQDWCQALTGALAFVATQERLCIEAKRMWNNM